MWRITVATQSEQELAGKEVKGRSVVEAGMGKIKGERDPILGGWEHIWVEDPWMGRWEKVKVPCEEADYHRRRGLPQRPSYWGESEAREWRRLLKEEKEAVVRKAEECRAWRVEEVRRREYLRDLAYPLREKGNPYGERPKMRRPYRYQGLKKGSSWKRQGTPSCMDRGKTNP